MQFLYRSKTEFETILGERCIEGTIIDSEMFDNLLPDEQVNFEPISCDENEGMELIGAKPEVKTMADWDSPDNRTNGEIQQAWDLSQRTLHHTPFQNTFDNTIP